MDSGLASASLRRPGMTRLWSHRFRQTLKTWRRSWHDALYQSGQGHAVRKQGDHKGRPYSETVYAASLEIRLARGRDVIVKQMLIVLGADVFGDLPLRTPIAPHPRPRLIEGVRIVHREG